MESYHLEMQEDQFHIESSSQKVVRAKASICISMEVDGCYRVRPSKYLPVKLKR